MRIVLDHKAANEYLKANSPKLFRKTVPILAVVLTEDARIQTREGLLDANKGDYLVMNDVEDEQWPWPVKKQIFEKTYVRVNQE